MTTTLYTQKFNPYAEKVARGLNYKGLPYERVVSEDPEDLRRWNPVTKLLPVLEIDGERLDDSTAILRWLEEHYPDPPLLSRDPKTAAAQERLADWSNISFVWYWNRWRGARFPRPGDEKPLGRLEARRLRSRFERILGRSPAQPSRLDLRELEISEELVNRLDDLVGMLGGRDFFLSDHPSLADLSVFGMLEVMRDGPILEGTRVLEQRPTLGAYMERVEKATAPRV